MQTFNINGLLSGCFVSMMTLYFVGFYIEQLCAYLFRVQNKHVIFKGFGFTICSVNSIDVYQNYPLNSYFLGSQNNIGGLSC